MRKTLLFLALLVSACSSPRQPAQNPSNISLELFPTSTPRSTATPNVLVIVETPLPTATPFIYVVESGDTLSEIAEKFKISMDELRAANPDISPNSMSIGTTLIIPDPSAALAGASTPTPAPVPITQTVCHPSADKGLWCFALIQNNSTEILENVSAQIILLDEDNNVTASQTAFTPLDIIPPNSSLPVYVFFPDTPSRLNVQVQLLSAIQGGNSRYLPVILNNTVSQIDWDGKSAQLSGQILLPAESQAATQVWVAAVAY
ncbi:MAG: LysM peptidoglycan-binding domain-containing protein, partial [Anaerolineales bacterium]|nr:LysM peptidoglycan-binding domain-containing protein [Anaerolineales bacterium]